MTIFSSCSSARLQKLIDALDKFLAVNSLCSILPFTHTSNSEHLSEFWWTHCVTCNLILCYLVSPVLSNISHHSCLSQLGFIVFPNLYNHAEHCRFPSLSSSPIFSNKIISIQLSSRSSTLSPLHWILKRPWWWISFQSSIIPCWH